MNDTALLLTVEETSVLLSLGRTKVYELIATGDLATVRIGRSRRIPRQAVERYVSSLIEKAAILPI